MKPFAIRTLDDIAEGFFHARVSDLPESKPCWQEIRKTRLSAAERSGQQHAAGAAKQNLGGLRLIVTPPSSAYS